MFNTPEFKKMQDTDMKYLHGQGSESQKNIDAQIDANMQQKEINSVRDNFFASMQKFYSVRKAKEYISLRCSRTCFAANASAMPSVSAAEASYEREQKQGLAAKIHYYDDELSRQEK